MYNIGYTNNIRNTGHSTKEQIYQTIFWNRAEESTCEYLDASSHLSYLQDPHENSNLDGRADWG